MADNKIYVGDIGTVIELDCVSDISTATVTKIRYQKPDRKVGEWPAVRSGNKISFTTVSGSLDQAGTWRLQAYVEMPNWRGRGETVDMVIHSLFD